MQKNVFRRVVFLLGVRSRFSGLWCWSRRLRWNDVCLKGIDPLLISVSLWRIPSPPTRRPRTLNPEEVTHYLSTCTQASIASSNTLKNREQPRVHTCDGSHALIFTQSIPFTVDYTHIADDEGICFCCMEHLLLAENLFILELYLKGSWRSLECQVWMSWIHQYRMFRERIMFPVRVTFLDSAFSWNKVRFWPFSTIFWDTQGAMQMWSWARGILCWEVVSPFRHQSLLCCEMALTHAPSLLFVILFFSWLWRFLDCCTTKLPESAEPNPYRSPSLWDQKDHDHFSLAGLSLFCGVHSFWPLLCQLINQGPTDCAMCNKRDILQALWHFVSKMFSFSFFSNS